MNLYTRKLNSRTEP